MAKPQLYCVQCNRPISHRGRCLACNSQAKTRKEAQDKYALKQLEV